MADIKDLLDFAVNKKPVEFQSAFNDIMSERISDAIETRKVEIAQSLYSENVEEADPDDTEEDSETEENEDL